MTLDGGISAILLAAGASVRMGRIKQLLPFQGKPLLQHVIDAVHSTSPHETIVVLGHAAPEIRSEIHLPEGARVVLNPEYASGQASSLRVGLEATSRRSRAALILMGDEPGIEPRVIRAVVERYRETNGPVVRAQYEGGRTGHPVILDRSVWGEMLSLTGDTGARAVLARHPEWTIPVPTQSPPPLEVDTPEDYQTLLVGPERPQPSSEEGGR